MYFVGLDGEDRFDELAVSVADVDGGEAFLLRVGRDVRLQSQLLPATSMTALFGNCRTVAVLPHSALGCTVMGHLSVGSANLVPYLPPDLFLKFLTFATRNCG